MVGPQDTYEAGPNGNEVLRPNPGTKILTTNHIYILSRFQNHIWQDMMNMAGNPNKNAELAAQRRHIESW